MKEAASPSQRHFLYLREPTTVHWHGSLAVQNRSREFCNWWHLLLLVFMFSYITVLVPADLGEGLMTFASRNNFPKNLMKV